MKQAIAYLRVSTEEQAEHGVSLDAQEAKVRAYCALHDLALANILVDAGVSAGKSLGTRPGGSEVLDAVRAGTVDCVVAIKLDRLFRNAGDCLTTVEAWEKKSVALHLVDMGGSSVDTSTAMGKFMLTVMAGVAEMERNLTRERTRTALQHKRSRRERTGAIPYGWQLDTDGVHLVPVDAEQAVITEARKLRNAGLSLRAVARELAQRGLTSRKGKVFNATQIKRLTEFELPGQAA